MLSIPLMVLAVALAVVPLIVMTHADHRGRAAEEVSPSNGTPSERDTAVEEESVPIAA